MPDEPIIPSEDTEEQESPIELLESMDISVMKEVEDALRSSIMKSLRQEIEEGVATLSPEEQLEALSDLQKRRVVLNEPASESASEEDETPQEPKESFRMGNLTERILDKFLHGKTS